MYRFRISFCLRMMVLAGVLVFGTPAGVLAEEADHSMEGQISKLSHLERVIQRVLWMIPQIILMDIIRSWGVPQWMRRIW